MFITPVRHNNEKDNLLQSCGEHQLEHRALNQLSYSDPHIFISYFHYVPHLLITEGQITYPQYLPTPLIMKGQILAYHACSSHMFVTHVCHNNEKDNLLQSCDEHQL